MLFPPYHAAQHKLVASHNTWWIPWPIACSQPGERAGTRHPGCSLRINLLILRVIKRSPVPRVYLNNKRDAYYPYLKEIYIKHGSRVYIFGKGLKINITHIVQKVCLTFKYFTSFWICQYSDGKSAFAFWWWSGGSSSSSLSEELSLTISSVL